MLRARLRLRQEVGWTLDVVVPMRGGRDRPLPELTYLLFFYRARLLFLCRIVYCLDGYAIMTLHECSVQRNFTKAYAEDLMN